MTTTKYDNHTKAGRAAIDRDVLKKLNKMPKHRTDIAEALKIDPDVASASLKRLAAAGKAAAEGERGQRRYKLA